MAKMSTTGKINYNKTVETGSGEIFQASINFPVSILKVDIRGNILEHVGSKKLKIVNQLSAYPVKKVDELISSEFILKFYNAIYKTLQLNTPQTLKITGNQEYEIKFIPSFNEQVIIVFKNFSSIKTPDDLRRLNGIWKSADWPMIITDEDGLNLMANDTFCRTIGMSSDQLAGKPYHVPFELINGEKAELFFKRFAGKVNSDSAINLETTLHNGKKFHAEVLNLILNDQPEIAPGARIWLTVFKDVTIYREAEKARRLLADIVDSSHDAIIGMSPRGIISTWNKGAELIFGYTKDEAEGFAISFLFPDDRVDEISSLLERVESGEKIENHETICSTRNGKPIVISASVSPILNNERITGISIIARDITRQKEMEKSLRENEELYRSLIETSPDAIALIDLQGNIIMGNRLVAEMLGFQNIETLLNRNLFNYAYQKDHFRIRRHALELIKTGKLKNLEYTVKSSSGNSFPVEISASIIVNDVGIPRSIIIVIRDITDRKKADEVIRNSERQFRSVWENSNDGMRLTDENGVIVAVNNAFCELVNMKEDDLKGKPFNNIYKPKDDNQLNLSVKQYKYDFKTRSFKKHKQSRCTFSCGKTVEIDVTYSFIEFEKNRPLLLSIFHDITEIRKVEEELRKTEKHAAIGKMAAYLSHEIKTPLASIKMNIDMLSQHIQLPEGKQKSFTIMQKEIKRLNNLLKSVLQFSREVDLVAFNINMYNLIKNIQEFLEPVLAEKNIKLINNIGNITIKGDYQKLNSVFLQLIENSMDAINRNGEIEIYSQFISDKQISIFVRDTGPGITTPNQIFDPFFTTKSSGTGLGLPIAQKIIEQHDGKISVFSAEPGNSIFELKFNNIKGNDGNDSNN